MENFDEVRAFVDSITNQNRRVYYLANARMPGNWAPDIRKRPQEFHVVQDDIPEALGCIGEVRPRIRHDFFEIDQRGFCDSNLEIH